MNADWTVLLERLDQLELILADLHTAIEDNDIEMARTMLEEYLEGERTNVDERHRHN